MAQPDGSGAAIPGDRDADRHWLAAAIDLSRRCPPSQSAFSVGAVVVAPSGQVIATGASPREPCARLTAAAGLRRVVIAWREPPVFVPGGGAEWLAAHGITVIDLPEFAAEAQAVNQHLLSR
jgi:pyrimidine deaminase RibD-like protein